MHCYIPQFEIQAASSDLDAVTSVSFFDGPKGVFGDMAIMAANTSVNMVEAEDNIGQVTVIDKGLPGDTSLSSGDDASKPRDGFGFQLYPSMYRRNIR